MKKLTQQVLIHCHLLFANSCRSVFTKSLHNRYFQAFLLRLVISYLESDVTSLGYGLGLTAGVFACEITRACAFANLMIFGAQTGTRVIMRFSFATVCMLSF